MHSKNAVDEYTLWALFLPTEKFAQQVRCLMSKYIGHYVTVAIGIHIARILIAEKEPTHNPTHIPDWPYILAASVLPDLKQRLLRYDGYQAE